jgi:hypothetical protein
MFAETLPKGCPPDQAIEPQQMTVFRLLQTGTPQASDFDSHAACWPEKYGKKCNHFSVSVFTTKESLARLLGMPIHRGKMIGRLVLTVASGRVQQTGQDLHHHDWWRYASFDAIAACKVENEE